MDQQSVTNCGVNLFLIFEDYLPTNKSWHVFSHSKEKIPLRLLEFSGPLQWLTIQPSLIVRLDFNLLDFLQNTEQDSCQLLIIENLLLWGVN